MIKIKIYEIRGGRVQIGNIDTPIFNYCYCVYLFGILIHSVTLVNIKRESLKVIFGNKQIIMLNDNHN